MSSIVKVLKAEIQRIVRREVAQLTASQKQGLAAVKKAQADSKRRIAALEKQLKTKAAAAQRGTPVSVPSTTDDVRVTAKALKSMRKRLGITQAELASLLGVSAQVVAIWETKKGRVHIKKASARAALAALKKEKKAEVSARLGKGLKPKQGGRAQAAAGSKSRGIVSGVDGAAIIKLRKRLGISQQQLATLAGVSNQLVSVWERKQGKLTLRAATARQLSDVMAMSKAGVHQRLG